jgi:hypothetical protein
MPSKLTPAVTLLSLIAAIHGSAQAALFAVDQGPYSPQNGNFAQWYQDTHGRTLDLCLGKALSSRVPSTPGVPSYMCTLAVAAGVFDDTQPTVFPTNFPDEAFWFLADAAIPTAGATALNLKYTAALEAAFGGGDPAPNDQISFARIRIRMDAPVAGTYTITHPYGVDVFQVDTPGTKAINMTRDIGIGSPGNYSGALTGDVGPFLRSVNGPYIETDPTTGIASSYIGDPNLTEQVTGSPFNTNFIHVEGPNGIDGRTDVFGITGKLSTVVRPTPVVVPRADYTRKNGGPGTTGVQAQEDVFALAPPPPGTAQYADTSAATVPMTEGTATGAWYGQSTANPSPPANVQVTADNHLAIATSTPTTVPHALTDLVKISTATYSLSNGQITVAASSSDETGNVTLTASGSSGGAIGALSSTGTVRTLTTNISPIPPAKVTVTSSNGGSDTEEVVIVP